jgi:hypothetical protein
MNAAVKQDALELVEQDDLEPGRLPAVREQQAVALSQNSPAAIMMQALSSGVVDLAQVEKMMDLQDRWEQREAEKAFNEALSSFRGEAIEVLKRKQVSFTTRDGETTSYKHAELSDVVDAVSPALAKHGFSYRWDVKQQKDWISVTCVLKHSKGHSEQVEMGGPPDASGKKNPIQQIVSTTTYLQRHTLKAITGIAEKGDDDDGRGGETDAALEAASNALHDNLLARLEKTTTDEQAATLWAEGSKALADAKRRDLYDDFKESVLAHRKALKNGGAK